MINLLRAVFIALVFSSSTAHADIIWVGSSSACSGFSVRPTLADALALAEINAGDDEIRLTSTVSSDYVGPGSQLDLVDWNPSTKGALTISGGYSNCFSSQSGRTRIGDANGPIILVRTTGSQVSEVTLRNLVIVGSLSLRGLEVTGNSSVFLQNTLIEDNIAGAIVTGGGFLDVDGNSRIQSNYSPGMTGFGGGIRCSGANSEVSIRGQLIGNFADRGGNLYLADGCFVTLEGGAIVDGGPFANGSWGGGIYVDNGGELLASGGSSRVVIRNNSAEQGAGLYIHGSGKATLINTLFRDNSGLEGTAIYAVDGGLIGSPQLTMDRASNCPFLISCSQIEGNESFSSGAAVYVENSSVRIQRTIFNQNLMPALTTGAGTLYLNDAKAFINRVGFIGNETYAPISTVSSEAVIRHVTAVRNTFPSNPGLDSWAMSILGANDDIEVYNSLFADTRGLDFAPFGNTLSGTCNLVDDTNNWPSGTVFQGNAQFINADGGDLRQLPSSPGVDMCNAQPGAPANDRDLEFELVPVNEFTNPQGNPGQAGGLWDAGVDEVYGTIGDDEFTLTVARNGSGSGSVVSTPPGIACGSDCSQSYFQGTLVTLFASADGDSTFAGWSGCPLPNGNECLNTVDGDRTITATFTRNIDYTLTIARNGSGSGGVVSSPAGIICGSDCSEAFSEGTLVTLTANADGDSVFSGWSGCPLANDNQCLNTVDGDRTITATFDVEEYTLTVDRTGPGSGRVTSSPAGIDCGADCSEVYPADTLITLTATADAGSAFISWVGCPLPNGNECLNAVDADRTITARFTDEDVIFSDRFQ